MEGKERAIIIDHAGNVALHGLPDKERTWSLDGGAPEPKNPDDDIPLKYCPECTQPFEVVLRVCPWCNHYEPPPERTAPKYVDGDLCELSPETLAQMRGEVAVVDEDPNELMARMRYAGASEVAWRSAGKRSAARRDMQTTLRETIAWFAHVQNIKGRSQSESYRRFYHAFGIDVLSAQALGKPEATTLVKKINQYLGEVK
jgi:hypothetical protein